MQVCLTAAVFIWILISDKENHCGRKWKPLAGSRKLLIADKRRSRSRLLQSVQSVQSELAAECCSTVHGPNIGCEGES